MCGIGGMFFLDGSKPDLAILSRMNESIFHRGPDAGFIKVFDNCGLMHRRLSILDLSAAANQPLSASNGRYWVVYNGEVYNYIELRDALINKGYDFKTLSDTEVVLNAYIEYGIPAFDMFNGMFAIAIYDILENKFVLARDRFGIKPLYYYRDNCKLVFGSEIKVIKSYPGISSKISEQALSEYLWYGNPLGNNTIYSEIQEVGAGSYILIENNSITTGQYGSADEFTGLQSNQPELQTRVLLEESVKRHLVSDVPVGIFLSGGIDSSAITAFASMHSDEPLNTYSVRFDFDRGLNELPLAAKVAELFNTKHHEVIISGADVIKVIEKLVQAHDEPFGDAANIPLYMLTKELSGKVKVVLQGDGGDEFFGGYNRYKLVSKIKWWKILRFIEPVVGSFHFVNTRLMRLQRFLYAMTREDIAERHALLLTMESKNTNPFQVLNENWRNKLKNTDPFLLYKKEYDSLPKNISELDALFTIDAKIILKDTFFEKVDKSTMANSIEVRVPFVENELANWALSLSGDVKVKNGVQKGLLKAALRGLIPDEILDGKKKGFGVPYDIWLKTSLKNYFIELINTEKADEILDRNRVLELFDLHCKGKGNYGFLLWKILILCIWLNQVK